MRLTVRSNPYTRCNLDFAPGYFNSLQMNGALIARQFGDALRTSRLANLDPGRVMEQLDIAPIALPSLSRAGHGQCRDRI